MSGKNVGDAVRHGQRGKGASGSSGLRASANSIAKLPRLANELSSAKIQLFKGSAAQPDLNVSASQLAIKLDRDDILKRRSHYLKHGRPSA